MEREQENECIPEGRKDDLPIALAAAVLLDALRVDVDMARLGKEAWKLLRYDLLLAGEVTVTVFVRAGH